MKWTAIQMQLKEGLFFLSHAECCMIYLEMTFSVKVESFLEGRAMNECLDGWMDFWMDGWMDGSETQTF